MNIIKKNPLTAGTLALGTGLIGSGLYNQYRRGKEKGGGFLDDRDKKYLGFAGKVASTAVKGIPIALTARYGQAFLKDKLARQRMGTHIKNSAKSKLSKDQVKSLQSTIDNKGALGLIKEDRNFVTSVADPNGNIGRKLRTKPAMIGLGASTVGLGAGLYGYQKAKDYYLI